MSSVASIFIFLTPHLSKGKRFAKECNDCPHGIVYFFHKMAEKMITDWSQSV